MVRLHGLAFAAWLSLFGTDAAAQSIEDVQLAFTEGRFLEAATLAEAVGTSDGYALAARSVAVYAYYLAVDEERDSLYQRAIRLGEEAVAVDPANPDAYLASAHATGRYAEQAGSMAALSQDLASKARELLETALAYDPDRAAAHVGLGAWHAGIVDAGRVARWLYGGNRDQAVSHLERALELAPHSKDVLLTAAVWLAVLDDDDGAERARELLTRAAAIPARDAWEELLQQEIETELAAMERER